ncbi:purine-nucleoside phosphorylase [Celeribacter marinus]|uniref:Purine nucleoside phosphorylase n=1 Tax=Celeribacter marinus TaxID=1397108 RepID=A0A0N9ZHF9_9RHOB|nr:purine-nucleoside phosphorylase [Celeribacter marinus]ALI56040.1 purine nucleoside phosphorylase [Celeribacter marinus]SFK95068.1 purine-nucleoside phosphorylase [Celeribacter marinus]
MPDFTKSLTAIRAAAPNARPRVGFILGSGLGSLADAVEGVSIPYADLAGFPHAGVSGHTAALTIGTLMGVEVAILGGREHYYENGRADAMRLPLEILKELGVETLFVTNACGSFRADIPPGNLMLINDHINYSGRSPLIGEPTDARFVNLTAAYDPNLRVALHAAAAQEGENLIEGVYAWYSGPNFETPAEIRMLKLLGADAVGMSTVPEVILARFLGLQCCAVSVVTNMAAGLGNEHISHEHTKASAPVGAEKLGRIIRRFLTDL